MTTDDVETIKIFPSTHDVKYKPGAFERKLGREVQLTDGDKILAIFILKQIENDDEEQPVLVFKRVGDVEVIEEEQ
jgi:hypothetical protein